MIQLHDVEQGTDEWLATRVGKYTGSNAYKLLGSMGATEYAKAVRTGFGGNFYTKRGHLLEDEAVELYEMIFQTRVSRPGYVTNTDYPECLYSPDAIDGETLVEVKCFGEQPHIQVLSGDVSLKIKAQIHFGMLICGFKTARLVAYNPDLAPGLAFASIPIDFDQDVADNFTRILGGKRHERRG